MSDPILLWNGVALEANRVSHTNGQGEQAGPPLSARALAIVHLAMYDAYAGVINRPAELPRYINDPPSLSPGASFEHAIAGAAYEALSRLFPSQQPLFESVLAGVGGDPTGISHQFGVDVAKAILADREHDPGVGSVTYKPSLDRGRHRPDPDNIGQGFHAPDYGRKSRGFGISQRFELARPPFDDAEYEAALRQVRGKGIRPELMGTLPAGLEPRTPDETVVGLYWAYDGALQLGTPPRLYNQIIRRLAMARSPGSATTPNSVAENARLFAFVNVALADAGILAWDQKYIHDFWRPVLGVREHDRSTGPMAPQAADDLSDDADPQWLPLGAPNTNNRGAKNFTPPFPAYPSGHATFGAAAFHAVRLFYRQGGTYQAGDLAHDGLFDGLDFVSEELNGISTDNAGTVRPRHRRRFPRGLWQMIEENGRSRVNLGVHWVFDAFVLKANGETDLNRKDEHGHPYGGVPLGLQIAEDVFAYGGGLAPKKSSVMPRPEPAAPPTGRAATYASKYL